MSTSAGGMDVGVYTMPGGAVGFTKENQDDHFVIPGVDRRNFIAGVLDGHGQQGKKVSSFVRTRLRQELELRTAATLLAGKGPGPIPTTMGASRPGTATADDVNGGSVDGTRGGTERPPTAALSVETSGALIEAYQKAQQALLRNSSIDCRESGSTAVTCARHGDVLTVANVGDSRCVLARQDPDGAERIAAVDLSFDHKPQRADEKSRIHRMNGVVEPARGMHGFVGPHRVWKRFPRTGGLAVSRAFGDTNLTAAGVIAEPEIHCQRITPADKFVILASDGVWDHVSSQEAVDIAAAHHDNLRRASEIISAKASEGWKRAMNGAYRDDITTVIVPLNP